MMRMDPAAAAAAAAERRRMQCEPRDRCEPWRQTRTRYS